MLHRAHAAGYHGHLEPETDRFLASLLDRPSHYDTMIDQYLGRITCLLGWGTPDPVVAVSHNAHTFMHSISPAGPKANVLPALMWLPEWLVRSKTMERRRHSEEGRLFEKLLEKANRDIASGKAGPSYATTLSEKSPAFSWHEAAYSIGMMANVAILTTGSPLRTFLLAMIFHPNWQQALREEVDGVLGDEDRLVGLADAPNLPILRAVIKECLRWRPVIPTGMETYLTEVPDLQDLPSDHDLGIPHQLEQDDVWNGYFIPKGAFIHAVEWSVLQKLTLRAPYRN
jgi:cytochrome P450